MKIIDLLMKIIDLLMGKDYKGVINMILQLIQRAIELNNNNLLINYLNILNLVLDDNIRSGNEIRLLNINKLIFIFININLNINKS